MNDAVNDDTTMPPLSSSCDSASSTEDYGPPKSPPELKCGNQCDKRHENHITSDAMQKIIQSIEEKQELEPIELTLPSPPLSPAQPVDSPQHPPTLHLTPSVATEQEQSPELTPQQPASITASQANFLESSASTVDTQDDETTSQPSFGSETSTNTEMSKHSIIRGFVPGGAPSSYRSQTNLAPAQPTPILKNSPHHTQAGPKKKGPMFTIGTSSGEDESSFESHMHKSSFAKSTLSTSFTRSSNASSRKQTSFKEEIAIGRAAHSPVFESDDEDEEVSESAIEDDDDSSDWEDSDEHDHSGPSSVTDNPMFQRVDSRPNLTSRRSLLTTQLHEPDRAKALANAASRSTPAIRRSNRSTPNGPSVATSPEPTARMPMPSEMEAEASGRSKPIIMTTSNLHGPALSLSPRTTRRNMLSTELTESLRKNLLWERQHRSTGNLAAMRKRAQPQPPPQPQAELKQRPEPARVLPPPNGLVKNYSNVYFDAGLQEYHAKGW